MHSKNEPKDIKACMNCGSRDLTTFDAITDPKTPVACTDPFPQWYICGNCDYCGIPIIFDSEEERSRYEELKKSGKEDLRKYSIIPKWRYLQNTKSDWRISIVAGVIFFIIGAINMFKNDGIGIFFYGASLFFWR